MYNCCVRENFDNLTMGVLPVDQFSVLHFAVGILAYFWNVPILMFAIIHILFEIIENRPFFINWINDGSLSKLWPGGKKHADTPINSMFDNLASILGWVLAAEVDRRFR